MTNRFKILAAALGLVIAAGAIGDVSAQTGTTTKTATPVATQSTAVKAMPGKTVAGKSVAVKKVGTRKVVAKQVAAKRVAGKQVVGKKLASKAFIGKHRRIHVAHRFVKHVKVAHRLIRAKINHKIAHKTGLRHVAKANIVKAKTTIVR